MTAELAAVQLMPRGEHCGIIMFRTKLQWKITILLWPWDTFLFNQMAKHVGLIPSLDGGLYQVNGDKVEVSLKKA